MKRLYFSIIALLLATQLHVETGPVFAQLEFNERAQRERRNTGETRDDANDLRSGNPVFDGWYADPEAIIIDDQYWIYPTYSAAYKKQLFFDCFSSSDLVHWTKHEKILDSKRIKWARYAMWAPSIIGKDNKFFLFFSANDIQTNDQIGGIGVAVADRPQGPFTDYLDKPLVDKFHNGAQPIDQFVFKDEDGTYYLIYGGWSHCNIAKLKQDFTGFIPFDDGEIFKEITPEGYVEGPTMFLKDGKYYFMWSEGGWGGPNYSVAYAIADSPLGPFKRIDKVLQQDPDVATGAGHHSVIHDPSKDLWYAVYHRRPLGETDANHRVTCIDEMKFDESGRILPIVITKQGVRQNTLQPKQLFSQQSNEKSLRLGGLFADNMVLQQQSNVAIWGVAKPGQLVSIDSSWNKAVAKATTGDDGKWQTTIATPAAGGPYTINIRTGDESQELKNVLIGEVWICSGQSNMQWKLRGFGVDHFKEDVEHANHPKLRFCQVAQTLALQPQDDVSTRWSVSTPQTALEFSAVAYFFGNQLRQELDVPIGLISTNWGGSSGEAWMNQDVIAGDFPEFTATLDGYDQLIEQHGDNHRRGSQMPKGLNQRMPSVLYNGMLHPLIPFKIRGVIWYQGESNVKQPIQYRKLFPKLIESWRSEWGQGDFPFYFVQIAPFHYRSEKQPAALLREAQFQALKVPNTGMVVTMDVGDPNNIHPKQKKPVGERLALLALANNYGQTDLVYSGPEYIGYRVESNQVRLNFKHLGTGLASRDGQPLSHFSIAGEDKDFHPARAVIDGDTILVSSTNVNKPAAVRFGWGNSDEPNFMNREGLPSSSFRTDDWEQ